MNIKVFNKENVRTFELSQISGYFSYCAQLFNDAAINWNATEGKILAVTHEDLRDKSFIPWQDINLIFAETCQQIYDYQYKFDYTKSYVFVTESATDFELLKQKFPGVALIHHFTVFNEVLDYGRELFSLQSHLSTFKIPNTQPDFDFFCLIGRRSKLRGRFVAKLSTLNLEKSLLKYHGEVLAKSGAPSHFDQFNYTSKNFYSDYHMVQSGMTLYSKIVQPQLYTNFRFEIQYETDAFDGVGWEIKEYHVTEKTIKPLIMRKPCLMYGAQHYHQWLNTYNIDLGHGNFDTAQFDGVESDMERIDELIKYLRQRSDFESILPNQESFQKNIFGLYQLSQLSFDNTRKLYEFIKTNG